MNSLFFRKIKVVFIALLIGGSLFPAVRPLDLAKWVILIFVITVVVVLTLLGLRLGNMFSTIVGTV